MILAGGLLTGGYVFRVLAQALARPGRARACARAGGARPEIVVLALALVSMSLGLLPLASFGLLQIGRLDPGIAP